MGLINFIFSSFWIFLGTVILLLITLGFVVEFFDFIVELIHGKPINQNFYNTEEPSKNLSLDEGKDGEEEGRD